MVIVICIVKQLYIWNGLLVTRYTIKHIVSICMLYRDPFDVAPWNDLFIILCSISLMGEY